jgi:hypothetical protein
MNNNELPLIKTWGNLYRIHEATNRGGLVKTLYTNKPFKKSWPYYATIIVTTIITFFLFKFSSQNPAVLLLAIPEIALIYAWVNLLIERSYKELCEKNNLKNHGFYQRQKLISYILFIDIIEKEKLFNKSDVELLVNWEKIRNEKYDLFSFFQNPVVLIMLTMTAGVLTEFFKGQIESKQLVLRAFLFLFFLALFFIWSLSDSMLTTTKINKEICQFLQWWKIDKIT